jgi:hypothetical protein
MNRLKILTMKKAQWSKNWHRNIQPRECVRRRDGAMMGYWAQVVSIKMNVTPKITKDRAKYMVEELIPF